MTSMLPHDSDEHSRTTEARNTFGAGSQAYRPERRRRKPTVIDGPFTETKELFGGDFGPPREKRR